MPAEHDDRPGLTNQVNEGVRHYTLCGVLALLVYGSYGETDADVAGAAVLADVEAGGAEDTGAEVAGAEVAGAEDAGVLGGVDVGAEVVGVGVGVGALDVGEAEVGDGEADERGSGTRTPSGMYARMWRRRARRLRCALGR